MGLSFKQRYSGDKVQENRGSDLMLFGKTLSLISFASDLQIMAPAVS